MKDNISVQSTILIVDDDTELLEVVKRSIKDHFASVLTADRAKSAIQILNSNRVDCVITDHRMPEMTGLELISHLKVHNPSIPVILMTGNGADADVLSAIEAGLFDYLDKPFRNAILLNRIRNALLLPKLESLIVEMAESEFINLPVENFLKFTPSERLRVISALEGMIRMKLQAKKARTG